MFASLRNDLWWRRACASPSAPFVFCNTEGDDCLLMLLPILWHYWYFYFLILLIGNFHPSKNFIFHTVKFCAHFSKVRSQWEVGVRVSIKKFLSSSSISGRHKHDVIPFLTVRHGPLNVSQLPAANRIKHSSCLRGLVGRPLGTFWRRLVQDALDKNSRFSSGTDRQGSHP